MDTGNSQQVQSAAPQTQDPQAASSQQIQQTGGLQSTNTPELLSNGSARISVPSNPADAPAQTTAHSSSFLGFWILLLAAVVILIIRVLSRIQNQRPLHTDVTSLEPVLLPIETLPSKSKKKKPKKPKHNQKKRSKR